MRDLIPLVGGSHLTGFSPPGSDYVNAYVLVASTNKTVDLTAAIAAGAKFVSITSVSGLDVYSKFGGAAAIPGADVTDGTASELGTAVRRIPASTTSLGLISAVAGVVTLSFWS